MCENAIKSYDRKFNKETKSISRIWAYTCGFIYNRLQHVCTIFRKKEIPQEVIQTLLKLAAGSEVQLAHYKDQDNSTQLLSNAEFK